MASQSHQSSRIPRKARNVPLQRGEWWGSIHSSTTARATEIKASDRLAFGDEIAATNAAALLNKVDLLKCSDCEKEKHFLCFPQCKSYPWRHGGRGYQCLDCQAKRRATLKRLGLTGVMIDATDEAYLRSKPNRRRRNKLNNLVRTT